MSSTFDIAIIGAGPAGMAAAVTASKTGVSVVVLDEKSSAGGQIYRKVTSSPLENPEILGPDYIKGKALVEQFDDCSAEKYYGASVWHVGDNGEVLFSRDGQTHSLTAKEVLICCGAMERPFPVPGWHLPGVMSAGSAQVMLKADGIVRENAVFVGTGPLIYLVIAQYLRLGIKVKALVDTTPNSAYIESMTKFPGAIPQSSMLFKGLSLFNEIRKAGVPVFRSARDIKIEGAEQAEAIEFTTGGKQHRLDTDHIFLHQGVVPHLNLTRAIGLDHEWDKQQLCWRPVHNDYGQSSVEWISVAGDNTGIVGADGAEMTGKLVALSQLNRLGVITNAEQAVRSEPLNRQLHSLNRFRKFIDSMYQPIVEHRIPQDETTVVCRCEERTVAELKKGFEQGGQGPNELKGLTRCGMGPCQGRQCGHTVSELLAGWRGEGVEQVGYYRLRSPMRLLNLQEFGQFSEIKPINAMTGEPSASEEPSAKGEVV
ncbi:FAD/NAD(P)-binding oxidoreductase [Endozoicomonas sp. OPT23]|uniref:FAD/NAD(P)-dependent oxidoreductase n=1 Tax=Endozoicomonas sp. OPT23 TaxID=2072845 RepID=UPI00129B1E65|nr:NAD(P)/FAD-dependent oxidoreductase [Endozoicomonas sp. OPT23]MRI33852.1 FAD/NAD(P)-binding oxidoreductase [Endozoicomonas sp. OPT23]